MSTDQDRLREVHGVAPSFTDADAIRIGKAFLVALSAASKLSEAEIARATSIAKSYGVSEAAIGACTGFRYWAADPDDHEVDPKLARRFVYEALRVARVSSYGAAEKARVTKMGAALGVPAAIITTMEGFLEGDLAIERGREAMEAATKQAGGTLPAGARAGADELEKQSAALRDARLKLLGEPAREK